MKRCYILRICSYLHVFYFKMYSVCTHTCEYITCPTAQRGRNRPSRILCCCCCWFFLELHNLFAVLFISVWWFQNLSYIYPTKISHIIYYIKNYAHNHKDPTSFLIHFPPFLSPRNRGIKLFFSVLEDEVKTCFFCFPPFLYLGKWKEKRIKAEWYQDWNSGHGSEC